jgi:hypothetical protein
LPLLQSSDRHGWCACAAGLHTPHNGYNRHHDPPHGFVPAGQPCSAGPAVAAVLLGCCLAAGFWPGPLHHMHIPRAGANGQATANARVRPRQLCGHARELRWQRRARDSWTVRRGAVCGMVVQAHSEQNGGTTPHLLGVQQRPRALPQAAAPDLRSARTWPPAAGVGAVGRGVSHDGGGYARTPLRPLTCTAPVPDAVANLLPSAL